MCSDLRESKDFALVQWLEKGASIPPIVSYKANEIASKAWTGTSPLNSCEDSPRCGVVCWHGDNSSNKREIQCTPNHWSIEGEESWFEKDQNGLEIRHFTMVVAVTPAYPHSGWSKKYNSPETGGYQLTCWYLQSSCQYGIWRWSVNHFDRTDRKGYVSPRQDPNEHIALSAIVIHTAQGRPLFNTATVPKYVQESVLTTREESIPATQILTRVTKVLCGI